MTATATATTAPLPATLLILGILDDGWPGLPQAAQQRLASAGLVLGAARTLALVAAQLGPATVTRPIDGALGDVARWVEAARAAGHSVVLLATGDPLCHGIAGLLIARLGADAVEVWPAPSTLQLAAAACKRPWQQARIVSVHQRDAGEYQLGDPPDHGLYALVRAAARETLLLVLTSPDNGPDRIARALLAASGEANTANTSNPHGPTTWSMRVAERLRLPDAACHGPLSLAEAASRRFADPSVVWLERSAAPAPAYVREDAAYAQRAPEKGLITKQEARAVALARLALTRCSQVWDIGAGSGAVGLEAAALAVDGHVWAIEKNTADLAIARSNQQRHGVSNYSLFAGRAPAGLAHWPDPDAVFIGGSGGELPALIELVLARLRPGGRLVMNFVTLENLATATAALQAAGVAWQVLQLAAARSQPILDMHRLAAENPVWIVSAQAHAAP